MFHAIRHMKPLCLHFNSIAALLQLLNRSCSQEKRGNFRQNTVNHLTMGIRIQRTVKRAAPPGVQVNRLRSKPLDIPIYIRKRHSIARR